MTTALQTTNSKEFDFSPRSIADAQSLSIELAKSMLVPKDFKGKPADVFAAITFGHELGLKPWAAMQSLIIIHGRVTMYADAMVALVLASDHCEYFRCIESTNTRVVYETLRRGSAPEQYEFTAEDAKTANLTNDNYRKFPKRMLGARAKSFLARDVYPDILRGLQSYEEMIEVPPSDYVETDGFKAPEELPATAEEPSESAEPPAEQTNGFDPVEMITECQSVAELETLGVDLAKLRGAARDSAKELYDAHMLTLKGSK